MLALWTFDGFCVPEIGGVGKWELMGGDYVVVYFRFYWYILHTLL
jgi:hypothetical protein